MATTLPTYDMFQKTDFSLSFTFMTLTGWKPSSFTQKIYNRKRGKCDNETNMWHDEDEMRQMYGRIAARQWSRLFSRSGDLSVRGTQA